MIYNIQTMSDSTVVTNNKSDLLLKRPRKNTNKFQLILEQREQTEKDIEKCMKEIEAKLREQEKKQSELQKKQAIKFGLEK